MTERTPVDIEQHIERVLAGHDVGRSRSSRIIAAYLRDNWHNLPFETGASIATATGMSEMTVIRFIRQIGFANLKEFKDTLKVPENTVLESMDSALNRFQVQPLDNKTLEDGLNLELKSITEAYKLTILPRWKLCVDLLANVTFLSVVGFQASKGLALDFATRLQYVRSHVNYIDDISGVFPEIFDKLKDNHCLVLIDTYAYSRKGLLLAEKASALGIPMIIVTDMYTNWPYDYTELVLQTSTYVKEFWDSPASTAVILNLLIGSVANTHGERARERSEFMRELGDHFDEFRVPVISS